jgi:PAS domain S-box-containing protein
MVLSRKITAQIREVLEKHPEGISITDLVGFVDINRNTAGRYLESMLVSGQVEMRRFGMAKLYTLAQRLPVASVLSISSELVLQLDFGMRVLYANDPLLTFLGIPAKDLFGKNIEFTQFSIAFEDVFPDLLDRFRRGLRGEEWHGELPRPVRRRFFFCRIAPTVSGEGSKGVSVLLEDITDQKRDEERLRTSEARLRNIFRVSPVGIGLVADRIFVEVNDRFCEMTGYSAAELAGKSARILYPSDEAFDTVGTLYYSQIRQSGAGSLETQWLKKDGTVIDILLNTIPLNPASISGGITFTALDITERKQAEQDLRQSEERLQLALSGSEMGMWELDIPSLKGSIDKRAASILGYEQNAIGTYWADWDALSHPEDVPLIHRRLADHIEGRAPLFESEHRMRHTSDRWIWVLGRGKITFRSSENSFIRISGTMQDITGRRQAEQALRESEEKYRYLVERSLQGLTILQNGRPVFANSAMLEISGYPYEEYLALSAEEMMATVHPDDRHLIATVVADRLNAKNIPAEHEFRIFRKDGTVRWVLTHGSLISYHGAPAIQIAYIDITDRKQAEQAQAESEERIRQITETLTSVFYVHDRALDRFVYVSPAYEKIWKRSCQSLYDNPYTFLEAVHPDDLPRLQEAIRRELEDAQYIDTDYRILQPDGTVRWIHSQNFPVRDAQGLVYRVAGIAEDITARRTAEDALRESEEKYRHVVEQSLQGLTIIQDGRHVYANPAMLGILGRSQEEYAATPPEALFEGIHPDDRDRVLAVARDNMAGRTMSAKVEFRFVRTDGGIRWILANGTRIMYNGKPATQVVFFDFTDRRNAEEALRESEEKFRSIVDTTVSGIGVHQDGIVRYINPAGIRILGYAGPEEILGRPFIDFVAPQYRTEVQDRVESPIRGMAPVDVEQFVRKDGTCVDVEVTGAPFQYNGRPAVLVVFSDITQRKQAEDALRESEDRYRKLVEISPNAVLLHRDGKVIYANRALARILGTDTAEGFLGKNVLDLIHQADREAIRANIAKDLTGASSPFTELQMIRADGAPVYVEGQGIGITIEGKPVVLVAINDITGRRRTEQVLRESEERYRTLAEASQDIIFLIGRDDSVEFVNSYAAGILGLPADQVTGKKRSSLFTGEPGKRQAEALRQVFETGTARHSEGAMEISGKLHWFDHYLMPITGQDGTVTSVLGVSRDISDRKETEDALRTSEERYRVLLAQMFDAEAVHRDGKIVSVNERAAQIVGAASPHDLTGRPIFDLISPDSRKDVEERIGTITADPSQPAPALREKLVRLDGTTVTVEVMAMRIIDNGLPAIRVMFREVPDRP